MSVENAYTDFHVDFGGSSVWYHVIKVSRRREEKKEGEQGIEGDINLHQLFILDMILLYLVFKHNEKNEKEERSMFNVKKELLYCRVSRKITHET